VHGLRNSAAHIVRRLFLPIGVHPLTVIVPTTGRCSDLALKQAEITALAAVPSTAVHYQQSQQKLLQSQQELIHSLIDRGALNAANILASVTYRGTSATLARITALQAQITATQAANPVLAQNLANTLEATQRQAVVELTASGMMSPATVLSQLSFAGAG